MSNNKDELEYLDKLGLALYDENLKAYIENRVSEASQTADLENTVSSIIESKGLMSFDQANDIQINMDDFRATLDDVTKNSLTEDAVKVLIKQGEAVSYKYSQELSADACATARANIGAAAYDHNHEDVYAPKDHTHDGIAGAEHNHDGNYASIDHVHDSYALTDHTHTNYSLTSHTHEASTLTTKNGPLSVAKGGTGATSAKVALSNLGAAAATHYHSGTDITSGVLPTLCGGTGVAGATTGAFFCESAGTDPYYGTLPVHCGGTGGYTAAEARANLGIFSGYQSIGKISKNKSSGATINSANGKRILDYSVAINGVSTVNVNTLDLEYIDKIFVAAIITDDGNALIVYAKNTSDVDLYVSVRVIYITSEA